MLSFKAGDRVTVLRPGGFDAEYHGTFMWAEDPILFVMPDGDDLDPVAVEKDRVVPEKS
jgi:hypothetical protein